MPRGVLGSRTIQPSPHGGVSAPEDILAETHLIAYYYHWSERDILALTRKKRHTYVEHIIDQVKRENGGSGDDPGGEDDDDWDD